MKILEAELKPKVGHLVDISLIVLLNDELAKIYSAVKYPKVSHLYPQKSFNNLKN
jgi:hypothetical protein